MRKFIARVSIAVLCTICYGQDQRWSATISYPIPIDQNFIGQNYTGFIDLGMRYSIVNYTYLSIASSFNASLFSNNDNLDITSISNFKAIMYYLEPKLSAVATVPSLELVHPYFGLGYSFLLFKISGINQDLGIIEDGETLTGFSFNAGFKIDVSNRVFLILDYDFTKVKQENLVPDTRYNRNINVIKLGTGIRF